MSSSDCTDVIIIGGGHNGLVAAGYLASAGLSVVVLEKNPVVGGAAITEEFYPGFRNSVASYTVSLLRPEIIRDLQLERFGLRIVLRPQSNFWPIDAERSLSFGGEMGDRQREIAKFSTADAETLPAFTATLDRAADVLRELVLQTPPNAGGGVLELVRCGWVSRRLMGLSVADQRLLTALMTKSAADFLDGWFESDIVKGAFAFDGIVGAYAAPSTPGTAYVLLHHAFGEVNGKRGQWGHAIGGMGAITQAMALSAEARGVDIRTSTAVREVTVANGRATGVILTDGSRLRARAVAANVGPKLLFRDLIPTDALPDPDRQPFTAMKTGSGTFRMNVALSELPSFSCKPGSVAQAHHGAGIIIGPSMSYLERAYLDAKQHGWSTQPIVEMVIPSTLDETLAPAGQHVASLFVQHVASQLPNDRSWANAAEKQTFADRVIATVAQFAPNLPDAIIARQILSPLDLEHRFGLVDGDIFHGQLGLDQLFSLRPVLGHANYRLPLKGLYVCGSGAHPGGGVTGAPGHNAAREMIRDLRGWRRHFAS